MPSTSPQCASKKHKTPEKIRTPEMTRHCITKQQNILVNSCPNKEGREHWCVVGVSDRAVTATLPNHEIVVVDIPARPLSERTKIQN